MLQDYRQKLTPVRWTFPTDVPVYILTSGVYCLSQHGTNRPVMVRTVQEGTNSPRYEQSKVQIVREPDELILQLCVGYLLKSGEPIFKIFTLGA